MERPDFPLVWDNSMRSSFVACPWKFRTEYLLHYKSLSPSVHLHAGKAWAAALEAARMAYYRDMLDPEEAQALALSVMVKEYGDFECPPYSAKSLSRMMEALNYYFTAFPLESDPVRPYLGQNGPMVEFSFALPLDDSLRHPATGEPIIYTGRADMVATYAGALSIYDDKTTSALGESWARQWDRRAQFTGYTWAARAYGIPVTQVIARGIAILKTKFNHAQAITGRLDFHISEWHTQIVRDISRAIECWKQGFWDKNLSDACSAFGSCAFIQPCHARDPEPWLKTNFAIRRWDPLAREEHVIERAENGPI